MTESAKWAELVKIHTTERRKNQFKLKHYICLLKKMLTNKYSILFLQHYSAFIQLNIVSSWVLRRFPEVYTGFRCLT